MIKQQLLQPSEHQLQTQLMQYLRTIGWYVLRLNSGKFSVGEGRNRRFINGQDAGTPDLLAFKGSCIHHYKEHVHLLFVEVKVPGNKPTALQTAKMKELEEYGATCLVSHSLEELHQQLEGY